MRKSAAKSARGESSAFALHVSIDGRFSPGDHRKRRIHITRSVEEGCETLPPDVRASVRRSGAEVSGMIRGPLGDIYSQVHSHRQSGKRLVLLDLMKVRERETACLTPYKSMSSLNSQECARAGLCG